MAAAYGVFTATADEVLKSSAEAIRQQIAALKRWMTRGQVAFTARGFPGCARFDVGSHVPMTLLPTNVAAHLMGLWLQSFTFSSLFLSWLLDSRHHDIPWAVRGPWC